MEVPCGEKKRDDDKSRLTRLRDYRKTTTNINERTLEPVAGRPQVRTQGPDHIGPAADMVAVGNTCMMQGLAAEGTCRSSKDMEAARQLGVDGTSPADTRRR